MFTLMNTLTTYPKTANQHSARLPLNWVFLLTKPLPPEVVYDTVESDRCPIWKVRQKQGNRLFPARWELRSTPARFQECTQKKAGGKQMANQEVRFVCLKL